MMITVTVKAYACSLVSGRGLHVGRAYRLIHESLRVNVTPCRFYRNKCSYRVIPSIIDEAKLIENPSSKLKVLQNCLTQAKIFHCGQNMTRIFNSNVEISKRMKLCRSTDIFKRFASTTNVNSQRNEDRENKISETVKIILGTMEKNGKIRDKDTLVGCIKHMFSLRLSPDQVEEFFTEDEEEIFWSDGFIPVTDLLYRNGLTGRRICRLVTKHPKLLEISPDSIKQRMEHFRNLGFTSSDILQVIERCPEIIAFPMKNMNARIKELEALFKTEDVRELVKKSPTVLFDGMSVIKAKFHYVFDVMGITQRQMMNSRLFSYTLKHIQRRHIFLVRSGFYKERKKKGEINPNPFLSDIIDIPDEHFVRKYGKMSLLDYRAFCVLFDREIQQHVTDTDDEESD